MVYFVGAEQDLAELCVGVVSRAQSGKPHLDYGGVAKQLYTKEKCGWGTRIRT